MKKDHILEERDEETARIYRKMKAIGKELEILMPKLAFLYDYLKHHESYFILFQIEDKLLCVYERDMRTAKTYAGDIVYARELIHQSVMLKQQRHHDSYPYRWYLRQLDDDIYAMARTASLLTYEYPARYGAAYDLVRELEAVRAIIIGSPYYMDELRAIEHANLVHEALQAQEIQFQVNTNN